MQLVGCHHPMGKAVILLVDESQIAGNGTGKDKNLVPLRMPQIGFVQDQPDSSISITDSDVSDTMRERAKKNVHEHGVDSSVARQPAIKRVSRI